MIHQIWNQEEGCWHHILAGSNNQGEKTRRKFNREIECLNCHKKGHKKAECWAKWGGKEGQGLRTKLKKDKKESKRETAGAVVEGVWMAITNDSEDKCMADDKFDDFTISEEDLFFSDEENKENEV